MELVGEGKAGIWTTAALAAVERVNHERRRASNSDTNLPYISAATMLRHAPTGLIPCTSTLSFVSHLAYRLAICRPAALSTVEWEELQGIAASWSPPPITERQGHPLHSMATFQAACED